MTTTITDHQAMFLIGAVEKLERNDRKEIFADLQEECVIVDVDLLCEPDTSNVRNCQVSRSRYEIDLDICIAFCLFGELIKKAQEKKKKGSFCGEVKAITAVTGGSGGGGGGESFNREDVSLCGSRGTSKGFITVHATEAGFPGMRSSSFRRRKAPPRWSDPRRVLLFFATLSSMGTIILLYFTLSMGRMEDKDVWNTW